MSNQIFSDSLATCLKASGFDQPLTTPGLWPFKTHLAVGQDDCHYFSLGCFDLTLQETFCLIRDPTRFLRIVGFRLVNALLLKGYEQVGGWVGVSFFFFLFLNHVETV